MCIRDSSKDRVYLTLYGGSQTTIPLEGTRVKLEQTSAYPFDGKVRLTVQPEKGSKMCIRDRAYALDKCLDNRSGIAYGRVTKGAVAGMLAKKMCIRDSC